MRLEGRALLPGTLEIAPEESNGQRMVAAGLQQKTAAVHQCIWAVDRAGLHRAQCLLHLVETVGVAQEAGQLKPCARPRMACHDSSAVLTLGASCVFLPGSDPG